ncbi:MAG: hypothetical protein R3C05_23965 [Pirellulaceae bacterium]
MESDSTRRTGPRCPEQRGKFSRGDLDEVQSPDIYYIILDGYARQDLMREIYNFDNDQFIRGLKDRNFYVAEKSNSNYAMTFLSLASSLNMQYLDQLGLLLDGEPSEGNAWRQNVYAKIRNNEAARTLKKHGYHYVHINTSWGGTESSDLADVSMPETLTEFQKVLVDTTMLSAVSDLFGLQGAELVEAQFESIRSEKELRHPGLSSLI